MSKAFLKMMHHAARASQRKAAQPQAVQPSFMNSSRYFDIFAGDVIVSGTPDEFLSQARAAFPEAIGYSFKRR